MGKYRVLGAFLDRVFRNDLNANFNDVDADIQSQKKRVDDLIVANPQPAEVQDARGGFTVLRDRLDNTDVQLADMAIHPYSRDATVNSTTRVTFYFDDGQRTDYDRILPITNAEGIVCNDGVFYQDYGGAGRITDAEILELQNVHGWEIDNHTYNHYDLSTLATEQEIDDQIRLNKEWLESIGINVNNVMYPRGGRDKRVTKLSRKYHRAGLGSQQATNKLPLDTFDIKRIQMDSNDLIFLQSMVDLAEKEKSWVVFYGHSALWDDARFTMFQQLIQYVKSKNIPIVTVSQALNSLENKLDVGDIELGGGFKVGSDGSVSAPNLPYVYRKPIADLQNLAIDRYELGKCTVMQFDSSTATGIPAPNSAGVLYTYRFDANTLLTFQEVIGLGFDPTFKMKRTWDRTNWKWGEWQYTGLVVEITGKNNASVITDFPQKRISYTMTNNTSGIPLSNGIGTLLTYNLSTDPVFAYQVFKGYNTDETITRRWTVNGWTAWTTKVKNHAVSVPIGTLAAGEYKTFVVSITGIVVGNVVAQPLAFLPDGITYQALALAANEVSIRVYNSTGASLNLGNRSFYFSQI